MLYYCRNVVLLSVIAVVGCKFATASGTLINSDNTTSTDDPHEIQKAVCTVTAGEVRASAEAVTTKTLQGVCGSAELHLALSNLEQKIFRELQEVKQLLREMQQQQLRGKPLKIYSLNDNEPDVPVPALKFTPSIIAADTSSTPMPSTTESQQLKRKGPPQLKSLQTRTNALKEKSFSYYWKLENFTQHINGSRGKVDSPVFSIKGKPLRITASFKHLQRDFLFLHLVYASFEKRDRNNNNIVLDTGSTLFKHIEDKVTFKHTIAILDQDNGSKNLVSQEFTSLDSGFTVPMSALLLPTYSNNNSLLIQISLYL